MALSRRRRRRSSYSCCSYCCCRGLSKSTRRDCCCCCGGLRRTKIRRDRFVRYLTRDSWSRDRRHVWPTAVDPACGGVLVLHAGLHVLRHSRTCPLCLLKSATNAFVCCFVLEGYPPIIWGDCLFLVICRETSTRGLVYYLPRVIISIKK